MDIPLINRAVFAFFGPQGSSLASRLDRPLRECRAYTVNKVIEMRVAATEGEMLGGREGTARKDRVITRGQTHSR